MNNAVVTNNRISQLGMALSGMIYAEVLNGTGLPIFTHTVERRQRNDSYL